MQTLTQAQLEDALTTLYQRFRDDPQAFDAYTDPRSDAIALAANIFEIVNSKQGEAQ